MIQANTIEETTGVWGSLPDWGPHCTAYLPIGSVVQKRGRGARKAQGAFLTRAKRLATKGRPLVFVAQVEAVEEHSSNGVDQVGLLGEQLTAMYRITVSRTGITDCEEALTKETSNKLQHCAALLVDKAAKQSGVTNTWARGVALYDPYKRALEANSESPNQTALTLLYEHIGTLPEIADTEVLKLLLPHGYAGATLEQQTFAKNLLSLCRREVKRISKPEKVSITATIGDPLGVSEMLKDDGSRREHLSSLGTIKAVLASAKQLPVPEACSELKISVKGAGDYCFETSSAKQDHDIAIRFLKGAIAQAKQAWIQSGVIPDDSIGKSSTPAETAKEQNGLTADTVQPSLSVGLIGDVANGKSTLVRAMTCKRTQAHSSEQQHHGVTIRLGFANAVIVRCENTESCGAHAFKPGSYGHTVEERCEQCGSSVKVACTVSFLDCPGHAELMATMLSGASAFDAAILAAASNVPSPSRQVKQHLEALKLLPHFHRPGRLAVAQTKAELLSAQSGTLLSLSPMEALERHASNTKESLKSTVAEDAPYFPLCSPRGLGLEPLAAWLASLADQGSPSRSSGNCRLNVLRSFDVNRPGTDHCELSGGVLGGTVLGSGSIDIGDELEIRPGIVTKNNAGFSFQPLKFRCDGIMTEKTQLNTAKPGGLVALRTTLNPSLCADNFLVGGVVGRPGSLPPVWGPTVYLENVETVCTSASKLSKGDRIVCHAGSSAVAGSVVRFSAKQQKLEVIINEPVCASKGSRLSIEVKNETGFSLAAHCSLFGGSCCLEGVNDESASLDEAFPPPVIACNDNERRMDFLTELNVENTDTIQSISLPKPNVVRDGGAHVVVQNFSILALALNRDPFHLKRYLEKEGGLSCVFAGDNQQSLRVQWRTRRNLSELIMKMVRRYAATYVLCTQCKSPSTDLVRKAELNCRQCGAKRFVTKI